MSEKDNFFHRACIAKTRIYSRVQLESEQQWVGMCSLSREVILRELDFELLRTIRGGSLKRVPDIIAARLTRDKVDAISQWLKFRRPVAERRTNLIWEGKK
jgi:hypothetical protein